MRRTTLLLAALLATGWAHSQIKTQAISFTISKCPVDTAKGLLYFHSDRLTQDFIDTGYYIGPCGGVRVNGYQQFPTWIPGTFIRNDRMVGDKWNPKDFYTQPNSGVFYDKHFRPMRKVRVYGLLVFNTAAS